MPRREDASDEELYRKSAAGDTDAFRELVLRYENMVVGYFARRVHDSGTAEDLAQEVYLKLWRHAGRYTVKAKLSLIHI